MKLTRNQVKKLKWFLDRQEKHPTEKQLYNLFLRWQVVEQTMKANNQAIKRFWDLVFQYKLR